MPHFIYEANIAHFKECLKTETDPKKFEMLTRLLAEEMAKYATWMAKQQSSAAE